MSRLGLGLALGQMPPLLGWADTFGKNPPNMVNTNDSRNFEDVYINGVMRDYLN